MLLTWVLFLGWTAVGLAILNAGRFRGGVRKLLLAPTIGFGAVGVLAFVIVRSGFPVGQFAPALGGAVLLVVGTVLWRTRTTRDHARSVWRRSRGFAAILGATSVLTGWPMLRYGSDWIANGNDDMANYCLGATGFRAHGYLSLPTPEELTGGQDATQPLWFLYFDPKHLTATRCGAELTLALVSDWTGQTPQQVFMPVILAFNLALVAATAGLVLLGTRRRAAALWAAGLLAVSSQTGYGVVQQLIAQAGGLALLCTSLALVTSPFRRFPLPLIARRAAVCGLTFAAQIVFYPETVPFLVGACVALGVRDLVCRRPVRRHLWHAGAAIASMAVVVPMYLYGTVYFLLNQSKQGNAGNADTVEVFPYFMTPRGPALVWGLLPTYWNVREPFQTALLVLGVVLFVALPLLAIHQFRRGRSFGAVLLVMLALGAALFVQNAAFGLFKIAMFVQPFLWATVGAWLAARRRWWVMVPAAGVVLAVAAANAKTQHWYVKQSTGHDGRIDLPVVTQRRLMTEFHSSVNPRLSDGQVDRVLIVTENNILTKLLSAELREVPNSLMTMAPFLSVRSDGRAGTAATDRSWYALVVDPTDPNGPWVRDPATGARLHRLMHTPADWTTDPPDRVLVVAGCGQLSILNRLKYPETGPALVSAPLSEVRNFVVFRDAIGARQNFLGMLAQTVGDVALYRPEPDPSFPRRTFAGVGRSMVLDVLNPSPKVRLVVSYTETHQTPDGNNRVVAPAQVVGTTRVAFGAVGCGAARLVSPPVEPQVVGHSRILVLDFNRELVRNPNRLSGFEALWGSHLPRDRRMLSAHAREISAISEEEYAAFRPPERLAAFPADLAHPHLEYSGLYEEGWVAGEFKVRLTQPAPDQEAVIRGQVPGGPQFAGFRTELTVLIDGVPVSTHALGNGDFELRVPAGKQTGPRWIECRASRTTRLPPPDDRVAVAHIKFIGFEPKDESKARPPERLSTFPADLNHPKLTTVGIALDGWVGKSCTAGLWHAGAPREAVVRGDVPVLSPTFRTELTLTVDGAEVARRVLSPGEFEVRVPVAGDAPGERRVECRFSEVQPLPAPDGRAVAVRLLAFGFEPPK